jgi:hypothetical protein
LPNYPLQQHRIPPVNPAKTVAKPQKTQTNQNKVFRNLIKEKDNNANEIDKVLQTQLPGDLAKRS